LEKRASIRKKDLITADGSVKWLNGKKEVDFIEQEHSGDVFVHLCAVNI
jgi:cold shock CspA family protein